VVVICGGNIDMSTLKQIYEYGLRSLGSFFSINITTSDAPGNLAKIISCAAEFGLKVHSVSHNRGSGNINWNEVTISISFYSNSFKHQIQFLNSIVTRYQRFPDIVGRDFVKDHQVIYKVTLYNLLLTNLSYQLFDETIETIKKQMQQSTEQKREQYMAHQQSALNSRMM
jgi:ACT domain-containing protein